MGEERPSSDLPLPVESTHIVQTLLETPSPAVSEELSSSDRDLKNINWAACKDFTVDVGKKQIAEYIQTWDIKPGWLYSLDFLGTTELGYRTFYHYRACLSTPTPQRPIQGTVSVFFVVDVQKARAQTLPVKVHFVVESNRLVSTAGRTRFKEKWLTDIIESKALLRSQVDF